MISGGEANGARKTISMRCFESFFKHTWRPQQVYPQMDTPSRIEPTTKKTAEVSRHAVGEVTELGEVRVTVPSSSNVATSTAHTSGTEAGPCKNGGCKVWSSRLRTGESRTESPWHSLKTVFLISVILAFLLWIIVYTLLDQYRIL